MRALSANPIQITAAASLAVLLIAFGVQLKKPDQPATLSIATSTTSGDTAFALRTEPDSDKDGVPDWQEALIGTDPRNPDSDGDGTRDAYSPLSYATGTTTGTTSIEALLEGRITSDFLNEYISLKQYNLYTPERGEQLGNRLANELYVAVPHTGYTIEEVKKSSTTSYEAMLAYRSQLRTALEPLLQNTSAEFVLYGRALEKDNTALFELELAAGRYKKAADNMMTLTVPSDGADEHLIVANSLVRFSITLTQMTENINNHLTSYALLREYNAAERELYNAFNTQAVYFSTKHREHIAYENE